MRVADLDDDSALGDGGQVQEKGLEAVYWFPLVGALSLGPCAGRLAIVLQGPPRSVSGVN